MDWYPWYPEIFNTDTMHLNPYQDGCYRRLIDHYMITRSPLPDNDAALARIVGDSQANWVAMASLVVRPFFTPQNGLLHLKRCDIILDQQDQKTKVLSESGRAGAKKRWNKNNGIDSHPIAEAIATPMGSAIAEERRGDRERKKESPPETSEETAFAIYNEMAASSGLSVAKDLNKSRRHRLTARLKDCGGIDGWRAAMAKVKASDFLTGRVKDWRADLDFILQESSFLKILEGSYDNRGVQKEGRQRPDQNAENWALMNELTGAG